MVVKLLSQIGDDPQPYVIHQVRLAIVKDPFEDKEKNNGDGKEVEHPHVLLEEHVIQGGLDEEGLSRRHKRDATHEDHGHDHLGPIRCDQTEKSTVQRHFDSLSVICYSLLPQFLASWFPYNHHLVHSWLPGFLIIIILFIPGFLASL